MWVMDADGSRQRRLIVGALGPNRGSMPVE